ncbi:hypothetical protein ACT8ZV_14660 [Nocardioides sp. MAHUQ-72]|uniref:hypothetical protein n=1 Tax=unclassified Nocardioides TaxID=2615069 RepID=UPI003616A7FC
MGGPVRTTRALVAIACLVVGPATGLAGCSGSGEDSAPAPTPSESSIAAYPEQPHVTTRVAVTVRAALTVMTDDECSPEDERRVCSVDGTQSWAPIEQPARATLVEARTRLVRGHTSWTTLLRFSPGSAPALRAAAREAGASGGVVVVMAHDRVLTAVPAADVAGRTVVLRDLDKPTAWQVVRSFG